MQPTGESSCYRVGPRKILQNHNLDAQGRSMTGIFQSRPNVTPKKEAATRAYEIPVRITFLPRCHGKLGTS